MEFMPNMENYLAQHDLVYEEAPIEWNCGIPLANGDMGALIWGDGTTLKITLDKYDVWELRTEKPKDPRYNYAGLRRLIEEKCFGEARQIFSKYLLYKSGVMYPTRIPLPRVELTFTEKVEDFNARLSIFKAVASGALKSDNGTVDWRVFLHSDKNLLMIELEHRKALKLLEINVSLDHLDDHAKNTLKKWGHSEPVYGSKGEYRWFKEVFPGGGYVVVWRRVRLDPSKETIFISALSFNDSSDPVASAIELIEEAVDSKFESLVESHEEFWRKFWSKSFISIPDSKMESLFFAEMYKLACSSKGRYPCSLQGLWTQDGVLPPWSGDYHLDMNVQEAYWPIYTSNHLELGQPLYDQFWRNLPKFEEMCRDFFGFEGAWSRCEMALDGTQIYGYYTANFWPGNGAWLAHMYWLQWLYSGDKTFLKERAYPFMRAFMQTYMNLLELGEDERYHLPLSNSPEWAEDSPEAWGADTSCDIALIRWLTSSLLETVKLLGVEDPAESRWREVLEKLVDYPVDKSGLQLFRGQPLAHSHRHHSHLMAIHPLGMLNIESNEVDKALIDLSVRTWILRGTGEWAGWSFPWASLIASRVKLANMAWQMLQTYFCVIKPNTFHVNGDYRRFGVSSFTYEPMTLEAGFCASAAIMEILLQSWGGRIRVFSAVPSFWKDAYFHRLRAEGAFLVTSKLKDRAVTFVIIESEVGGVCRVVNPFEEEKVTITDRKTDEKQVLEGRCLEFHTVPQGKYLLIPHGKTVKEEELSYVKFERRPSDINYFGVKKMPRF